MIPQVASTDATEDAARLPDAAPVPAQSTTTPSLAHDDEQEQPPRKRRRTGDIDNASKERTRHEELWYNDGNIVVCAETTLFRVHMSVLKRHFPPLDDMLSKPEPEEQVDGCPIVQFHESAADVAHMIGAFYSRGYDLHRTVSLDYISAILRMGTKYKISHLEREAVKRLLDVYPTSLNTFRSYDSERHPFDPSDAPRTYEHTKSEPFRVLTLVESVRSSDAKVQEDLHHIATLALYVSCQYGTEEVDGIGFELDSRSRRRYSMGRSWLQQERTHILTNFMDDLGGKRSRDCANCRIKLANILKRAYRHRDFVSVRVLDSSAKDGLFEALVKSLCSSCRNDCARMFNDRVEEAWQRLSQVLHIAPAHSKLSVVSHSVTKYVDLYTSSPPQSSSIPSLAPVDEQEPCKRRLMADADDNALEERTRHEELWYDDGTIVIIAETTLFRVHMGVLKRECDLFGAMFSMPQPEQLQEQVDGCPVVLFHDSAADVGHMLAALYSRGYEAYRAVSLDYISAILRLGLKYGITRLEDEAVNRLLDVYPMDCDAFQRYNKYIHPCVASEAPRTYVHTTPEPFRVLKLVESVDSDDTRLKHIANLALYVCCQFDPKQVLFLEMAGFQLDSRMPDSCAIDPACVPDYPKPFVNAYIGSVRVLERSTEDEYFQARVEPLCPRCRDQCVEVHDGRVRAAWRKLNELFGIGRPFWYSDYHELEWK
ncbi:hypothetical protein FA95DRAFT_1595911 [Auriscalpium vulgare]|uniref:Uncharacterized protein n=1 Tax=Auriscalpium vulgare TaxID=40419 RepID=A0ACB8RU25_9AGAM|nr:hypothetical protein FA95DRAFT_1595911 [Auriscalpium vulgare]